MVTLQIPCPHQTGEVKNTHKRVDDYHPLTYDEIKELLDMAAKTRNGVILSRIQVRLTQGIKGMVCPRECEGPVAIKEHKVSSLFLASIGYGGLPRLVTQFYKILNS